MAAATDFANECCLCLQIFTDPRVLPCLHTFCLKCLGNIGATIPNDWLLCPVCESNFNVPEDGLTGLPRNIIAGKLTDVRTTSKLKPTENTSCDACVKLDLGGKTVAEKYCINCEEKLCLKCCEDHDKEKEHLIVDLSCKKEDKNEETEACRCRVHQEEVPTLYCIFCKKVICDKCFHESHSSHSCSEVTDILELVCKHAAEEYENVESMKYRFQDKKETLHREQMKFLEKVKKSEAEILKRCESIKELVVKETKALLQELAVLKTERLEEIEMEQRRIDKHIFTLEKFKEYCAWIQRKGALSYACEAEFILRNTADDLRNREESRIEKKIFQVDYELRRTEIRELLMPISNAIGKINVTCPYKMELPITINTNERTIHGIASLRDKLYLLSDSVFIHRAVDPYDCVGEIKTPDIKSPTRIVSCSKTSRLYIYDKENSCIWKVSIPDHQVTRWFDKVQEPCVMSVTQSGEVLMTTPNTGTEKSVTAEIYNLNAILTDRIELPKSIQSLKGLYKTQSGKYIGFEDQSLYKFRADGSTVCQLDIAKSPDIGSSVRCLAVSPYHVFLFSSPSAFEMWSGKPNRVSLITSDLAFHRSLLENKEKTAIGACFVNATKRLAVLEQFEEKQLKKSVTKQVTVVTVYNVL